MKNTISIIEDFIYDRPHIGLYKAEKRFSKEMIFFLYKNIYPGSDNLNLINDANRFLLNQLIVLSKQGKNKRNIEIDEYLLINWFKDFIRPL